MNMNAESILNRIMVKLGMAEEPIAVELEQKKTEDGQAIFEADAFEIGQALFIVTEDGKIPAPMGEFALEDGSIVSVDENGTIVEISTKGEEEADKENEQPMPEEAPAQETVAEKVEKPKKTVKTKTEMEESYFSKHIAELEAKFEARLSALEAEKVALSAHNEELLEKLANEPAPHTSFNPEATSDSKLNFKLGAKRAETITDRVFNQLF